MVVVFRFKSGHRSNGKEVICLTGLSYGFWFARSIRWRALFLKLAVYVEATYFIANRASFH